MALWFVQNVHDHDYQRQRHNANCAKESELDDRNSPSCLARHGVIRQVPRHVVDVQKSRTRAIYKDKNDALVAKRDNSGKLNVRTSTPLT